MKLVSKFVLYSLAVAILLPAMVFFQPNLVKAADDTNIMTQCWEEPECTNTNGEFVDYTPEAKKACGEEAAKKGKKLGFCYAINPDIKLQVPIPTTSGGLLEKVSGFAEYLSVFYKFFMAALAVMAVVVIMWAGFKRILAAGRAEAIKDANEAFFSAIVGLVIALLSYSLLSLVNPKLVEIAELRIPKIKTKTMSGNWCPIGTTETFGNDQKAAASCGNKYSHPQTGNECIGQSCPGIGSVCIYPSETSAKAGCADGLIATGSIRWSGNAYIDHMALAAICQDNKLVKTRVERNLAEGTSLYVLGAGVDIYSRVTSWDEAIGKPCGNFAPRGYVLLVEVNDDRPGYKVDDVFAVGKAGTNCKSIASIKYNNISWSEVSEAVLWKASDFPLAPPGTQLSFCRNSYQPCSCGEEFPCESIVCGANSSCSAIKDLLSCNLLINRTDFPALGDD